MNIFWYVSSEFRAISSRAKLPGRNRRIPTNTYIYEIHILNCHPHYSMATFCNEQKEPKSGQASIFVEFFSQQPERKELDPRWTISTSYLLLFYILLCRKSKDEQCCHVPSQYVLFCSGEGFTPSLSCDKIDAVGIPVAFRSSTKLAFQQ